MMLDDFVGELIDRLDWEPTRDPKSRFRFVGSPSALQHDRQWAILPSWEISGPGGNKGTVFEAVMSILVHWSIRQDYETALKDIASDIHELIDRISYYPGSEWSSNFAVMVSGASLEAREDLEGYLATITMRVLYSST